MICPSCRGRVRGQICDGCGARIRPVSTVCDHQAAGPARRGTIVSRDGVARGAWIAYCRGCSAVMEMGAPAGGAA